MVTNNPLSRTNKEWKAFYHNGKSKYPNYFRTEGEALKLIALKKSHEEFIRWVFGK